jgi:hypothetical protein
MIEILSKMYIGLRVKYRLFLPDFNETRIIWTDIKKKYPNINFYEYLFSGSGKTDGQT